MKKKTVRFRNEGGSIDYLFLSEANQWLNKTVYSLFAYKALQLGRYDSWALATLYYSRFFLNCGLSRLQGCALDARRALVPSTHRQEHQEWVLHGF